MNNGLIPLNERKHGSPGFMIYAFLVQAPTGIYYRLLRFLKTRCQVWIADNCLYRQAETQSFIHETDAGSRITHIRRNLCGNVTVDRVVVRIFFKGFLVSFYGVLIAVIYNSFFCNGNSVVIV